MKTLADFQPLKPAEETLLECCQSGEIALIGEERPTEKTEANEIRAEFLRWLILFSKVDIDPKGIIFQGAWVSDCLDLENVKCSYILGFIKSVFEEEFVLRRAITRAIYLDGSSFYHGISADGLICHGNIHLRQGFDSKNEVRFLGSTIDGDFDCLDSVFKFNVEGKKALHCDGIRVKGDVILTKIQVEGIVRFLGAQIEGNFSCSQGVFKANSREQEALNCNNMQVEGALFLHQNCTILIGYIDLTSARVGVLVDDENFWKQETLKKASLDGFKYGHIYGSTSASFRLDKMLSKMPNFSPHPYRQLSKVLRDMGHDKDADEVMIALNDKRLVAQIKVSFQRKINNLKKEFIVFFLIRIIGALISYVLRKVYKWTSAYGYRPMRAFGVMLFVWLSCGLIYDYSAKRAVFAPTNPLIYKPIYQDQPQETNCTLDANGTPWFASAEDYNTSKNNWYYATHAEYTTFQPYWYSLDIILPVVDLKMENDWSVAIPSPHGSFFETYNYFVRSLVWIESLIGWGLSLMLAAILSGLAKNEKE